MSEILFLSLFTTSLGNFTLFKPLPIHFGKVTIMSIPSVLTSVLGPSSTTQTVHWMVLPAD